MNRSLFALAWVALALPGAVVHARSRHAADSVDRVQGVRLTSRIPCDGATNPQEQVQLETTFSPGGWQRAFHLDVFESQYCKRLDLYFFCLTHGHDRWKQQWSRDSTSAAAAGTYWINSCAAWGSKDVPEYILSGWYGDGAADRKVQWKQAAIKKVSENPEVYEFTDPQGGTARIEIQRK